MRQREALRSASQSSWQRSWQRLRRRRGFVLLVSLGLILIILATAVLSQTVALSDLRFAARSLLKTQAYLNARSGIEVTLIRLIHQPDLRRLDSAGSVEMSVGTFRVDISPEVASAFGDLLTPLGADTPVYLIESVGRVPFRGKAGYTVKLLTVVHLEEGTPKILLWSENPASTGRPNS